MSWNRESRHWLEATRYYICEHAPLSLLLKKVCSSGYLPLFR